ncbi:aspartate aminotransferase family protein, partial [Pseudomonadota bacterium]|nr:aspartate aminotransferase family protein [Pseudomonadota bacterium]
AGVATLSKLKSNDFYQTLLFLTEKLTTGFQAIAEQHNVPLACNSVCGMFGLFFSDNKNINCLKDVEKSNVETFNKFFHLMLANGVNFAPSPFEAAFVSIAHDEKIIEQTLAKAEIVFSRLK